MVSTLLEACAVRNDVQARRFLCLVRDGNQRMVPVQRRDRTPRTYCFLIESWLAFAGEGNTPDIERNSGISGKTYQGKPM